MSAVVAESSDDKRPLRVADLVMPDALALEHISKTFPGVRVLRDVTLRVRPGEVHALVGENGAGKSTLIKVASGAVVAESGRLTIAGQLLAKPTPAGAQAMGLRVVHQERQIAPDLTVAENVLLDRIPARFGVVNPNLLVRAATRQLASLGIDLDPRAPASSLGVAQQQLVELARAVSFDARIIIMDEATASLHRGEVVTLFALVNRLREMGIAVLYISHHLDEIFHIADVVTVLRDGEVAGSRRIADTTAEELTMLIFGEEVAVERSALRGAAAVDRGEVLAVGEDMSFGSLVKRVNFTVHQGEIVALTGGVGSGTAEVARLIAGVLEPTAGILRRPHADGSRLAGRPGCARSGIAFLPADRKREGLLMDQSVSENVQLSRLAVGNEILIRARRSRARARKVVARLRVRVRDVDEPIIHLSGGNQQKVILGRWLDAGSHLFVFDEPTAGIDVASRLQLYRELDTLTRQGATVVMVSSDYEEIAALADRVYIMSDGKIVAELAGAEATPDRLFRLEMGLVA